MAGGAENAQGALRQDVGSRPFAERNGTPTERRNDTKSKEH